MGRPRRFALAALAGAGLALALAVALFPPPPLPFRPPAPRGEGALLALLAAGDTGDLHALPSLREGQLSVARGMVAEDLRQPADALLLLGDNFYPDGLRREELVARVRRSLVWPYCRFVELAGPRSPEVAGACTLETALRRPVPIYAVLGNHDHTTPESPDLQRRAVGAFVSNWHLPSGLAEVFELAHGVSLILVDSPSLTQDAGAAQLRDALLRARGPWRILAAHHPIAPLEGGGAQLRAALARRALAEAGVPVQLVLTGHSHNLQVIELADPLPGLHVIAGSGSTVKPIEYFYARRRFAAVRTGFVRVELRERGAGRTLSASLYATPRYPAEFWRSAERIAHWSVDLSGRIHEEDGS